MACKSWSRGPEYQTTTNCVPFLRQSRCLTLKVIQMTQKTVQDTGEKAALSRGTFCADGNVPMGVTSHVATEHSKCD